MIRESIYLEMDFENANLCKAADRLVIGEVETHHKYEVRDCADLEYDDLCLVVPQPRYRRCV